MSLANNLKYLRKKKGKTQESLSADLNIGRTTIANYEAGISEPNIETLKKFASYFGVALDDLLSNKPEEGSGKEHIKNKAYTNIPKVITIDSSGNDNIIYIPVKARAGYLNGYGDPEFIDSLGAFRLPGLNNGTYRMFEVEGLSMAPNILPGDRVIGEWVERLDNIADNRVYVVVHEGGIVIKRIINRLRDLGKLYLKSDSVAHKHEYPTIEISPGEIKEVWQARLKLSSEFGEPSEVDRRIATLEMDITEMKSILKEKNEP